ncbi:MAG: phospho-sugar mutase [Actinobacteria bacterium]|nr:phospho-sugar mutase [Actinomycetota bacterium]
MTDVEQLIETANLWIAQDFDPTTISELNDLISKAKNDSAALAELNSRFSGALKFGTAGLRAQVAAGESRMNRATVAKAAWGVTKWIEHSGGKKLVIGNDARTGSKEFALDSCQIAAALGLDVVLLAAPVPTPVLAYGLLELNADAAVMVTASHNPAQDNGYKVYDQTGSQIVSPTDHEIAELIKSAPKAKDIDRTGRFKTIEMVKSYVDYVASNSIKFLDKDIAIAYTALHGVGSITFNELMQKTGYTKIYEVYEQQIPDPNFSTVKFPNPEEPGAMDLLLDLAVKSKAEIAIANDPDADRTAIALPRNGTWQVLSGDELGTLLAWWVIERRKLENKPVRGAMAASIVSGSMIKRIALANDLDFFFTLTGFKYVSRIPNLIFGYEEAIGYCVLPEKVKDKDGISAALFAIELVNYLKSQNKTAFDKLDELYRELSLVLTKQITLRMKSSTEVNQRLEKISLHLPKKLGQMEISSLENFGDGIDGLPKTSGIRLRFPNGRVIIRPSGTEPKLKCYLEVYAEPGSDLEVQKQALNLQLSQLSDDLTALFNY